MNKDQLNINVLRELMSEEEVQSFLASLSDDEALALLHDYRFLARTNQLPPEWEWFGWVILSGRGFGKTWTGSNWVTERAEKGYFPIVLAGETSADVRDVMIEAGESSIIQISHPDFKPTYHPSKRRLVWPNGAWAVACSGQDPDQFRGLSTATAWFDEPAKWDYVDACLNDALMGLRESDNPQFLATTTPRPIPIIKEWYNSSQLVLGDKATTHVTTGSTFDNAANLAPQFLREMKKRYEGTRLGEQELQGKILWEMESALWKQAEIDQYRVSDHPPLTLTALALDPTVGDPGSKSRQPIDECGIMLGGIGTDSHGYLTHDFTMRGTPAQWAQRVKNILDIHNPMFIVAEKNNGGLLIQETLTAYGIPASRIVLVHAAQGKLVRAEPVSLLSEQGSIHHVGEFPPLESELITYEGKGKSPNRLDAFVWLFTFLMLGKKQTTVVQSLNL